MAYRFPVESGLVLMFARAVGDPNPIYHDPDHAAGTEVGRVIAPPTFVAAGAHFDPDHPLRPHAGQPWFGSGREPTGRTGPTATATATSRVMHGEQHFVFHRLVCVGQVLTVTTTPGRTWQKDGRRGRLTFSETLTEYRDESGELLVTARSVRVELPDSGGQ